MPLWWNAFTNICADVRITKMLDEYEPHEDTSHEDVDFNIEDRIEDALAALKRRHPLTTKEILEELLKDIRS